MKLTTKIKPLINATSSLAHHGINYPALIVALEIQKHIPARSCTPLEVNDTWDTYGRLLAEKLIDELKKTILFSHPLALEMTRGIYAKRCLKWRKPLEILYAEIDLKTVWESIESTETDLDESTANRAFHFVSENLWKYREHFAALGNDDREARSTSRLVTAIYDQLETEHSNIPAYKLHAMRMVIIYIITNIRAFLVSANSGNWETQEAEQYLLSVIGLFIQDNVTAKEIRSKLKSFKDNSGEIKPK